MMKWFDINFYNLIYESKCKSCHFYIVLLKDKDN
jgi:hypothetical protein